MDPFLTDILKTLLTAAVIGAVGLLFRIVLVQNSIRRDMQSHRKLMNLQLDNMKSQYTKIEEWIDKYRDNNPFELVAEMHEDLEAVKGALKSHDQKLQDLDATIQKFMRAIRKLGVSDL